MRTFWTATSAMAAAAALGAASPSAAATMLNAGWSDSCGKSNCFNDQGVFTQTFSASSFSGPVNVGQLLLDRSILGDLDGSTFRLSFQLNGQELGTWGNYNMAGIGGDELTFGGADFVWNPEDGDLVLVLAIVPPPKPGAGGFFAALGADDGGDPPTGPSGDGFGGDFGGGVVDGIFQGAVPEPATWALMITGFGLAGMTLRRRARVVA